MATYLIGCTVAIGTLVLNQVNEITVRSSWKELADTATIKVPLLKGRINPNNVQETLADQIKVGQRVTIEMSYWQPTREWKFREFSGYVRKVTPGVPLEIECEDAAFLFRRKTLEDRSWSKTKLINVINYIVGQVNQDAEFPIQLYESLPRDIRELELDSFRVSEANAAEALQKLKEEFRLVFYFRDQTLFVGVAYTEFAEAKTVKYDLSLNVQDSKLTWRLPGDTNYRVKYTAITKSNQKIETEFPKGKTDGELVSETTYKVSDQAFLNKMAESTYNKLKAYEGYEGSIEAFLIPYVKHGDKVELIDPEYENRKGNYAVDEVETKFGNGIVRTITLGKRLGA